MKRCRDCGEIKPLEEFPRNRRMKDGRHTYCKPSHNARGKETVKRLHGSTRHYHLKRRYGIGADEFDALVVQQGGVCPTCRRADPEHGDHSHVTGEVRGILCFNCNGGLGQFRDSPDALRKAAGYLEASDAATQELVAMARTRAGSLRRSAV